MVSGRQWIWTLRRSSHSQEEKGVSWWLSCEREDKESDSERIKMRIRMQPKAFKSEFLNIFY
jgi:hypothetical protein